MTTSVIFDSHAHYDSEAFDGDREEFLSSLPDKNVGCVVNVGADLKGCGDSVALASRYPYFYAGVGIHPECCGTLPDDWLAQVEKMAACPKVVAIGGIGLDYHFDDMAPKEVQRDVFIQQILLAQRLNLPVVVHDRDAHGDTLEILQKYRPRGVVHCFSGSVEMMREVVNLGMYVGLGGAVTFKNARVPVQVAAAVPLDRMLLETDAPYMAPVPFRGKRCDSSLIALTAAKIAQIRETVPEEILRNTFLNACRLFQIEVHLIDNHV